jgi:hypothetical protein
MLVKRHGLRPSFWPIADFAPIAKPLRLSSGFAYSCKANGAMARGLAPNGGAYTDFGWGRKGGAGIWFTRSREGAKKKAWAARPLFMATMRPAAAPRGKSRFAAGSTSSRLRGFA